jgi:uncharacterized protein YecE (DUF72 family)
VLREYFIGTGGWAYFRVPGLRPLVAYSKAFNFVEVNSTFYQIPPLKEAETWRKMVPQDFQFAVRAHRSISQKFELKTETLETLERIKRICTALNAAVLHVQVPASLSFNQASVGKIQDFLSHVETGDTRLAMEFRGASNASLPPELTEDMKEHDVIHSVDLSKGETPACESDVLYSRLFGKGSHNIYQPTDDELVEIDRKALKGKSEKAFLSFHFISMYKDAARLKIYRQTGKFPKVTKSTGLASLQEVLSADQTQFPISKQQLIHNQGWKLFDLTRDLRIRAGEILQKLPERIYNDINEVIHTVQSTTGMQA